MITTREDAGRAQGIITKENTTRKDDGKEERNLDNMNTEDGVTLRGRGCNVPLAHPK